MFVMCVLLAGCSSVFYPNSYYPNNNVLQQIYAGMSQDEVTKLLGNPSYRRINHGREEWEYRKWFKNLDDNKTVIVVGFEDGKLTYLDSFKELTEKDLEQWRKHHDN